jgi:hypothetical protein
MTTKIKFCFLNTIGDTACPNCGHPLQTVDYYTARPVKQEEVRRDYNSRTIAITYTDVNPHSAAVCLHCARAAARSRRTAGLALLIGGGATSTISMFTGLVRSTLAQNAGENVGAALGLPMTLMCVFLIVAIVGLSIYLGSRCLDPDRKYTQDQLYSYFIKDIEKESQQVGVVYLTPAQVKQMKRS